MTHPSHYWTLKTLQNVVDVSNRQFSRFPGRELSHVQAYFQTQFPEYIQRSQLSSSQNRQIQTVLFCQWYTPTLESQFSESQALAGLCLRCYISHGIVQTCQDLARQFGERYGFTDWDLLPIVLTDDGQQFVVWCRDRQTQLQMNGQGEFVVSPYPLFAIQILAKFNPKQGSLTTWTRRLTRCHPQLQETLRIEYGCLLRTPWSILNGVTQSQRQRLSPRDHLILDGFHRVYRRDRRGRRGRCPDPCASQLAEMLHLLSQQEIYFESGEDLLAQLLRIAEIIRQSIIHPVLGNEWDNNSEDIESQQLMVFLEPNLIQALADAIAQEVPQMIHRVQKSRKYYQYATSIIPALKLLYFKGKSQREIADCLRMSNQSQVCRVLKLKQLLNQIRYRVVEQLFPQALNRLNLNRDQIAEDIKTFDRFQQHLEQYVDEVVFQEAIAELRAGQNRRMESLFAQQMCQFLAQYSEGE
jgi:hypothetical protein